MTVFNLRHARRPHRRRYADASQGRQRRLQNLAPGGKGKRTGGIDAPVLDPAAARQRAREATADLLAGMMEETGVGARHLARLVGVMDAGSGVRRVLAEGDVKLSTFVAYAAALGYRLDVRLVRATRRAA